MMCELLDLRRIEYECKCGSWYPISYMYYCPECVQLKCDNCSVVDIDGHVCPVCIDETSLKDASREICSRCYICPVCEINLVRRSSADRDGGNQCYLFCTHCAYRTKDTKPTEGEWTMPLNSLQDVFNEYTKHFKEVDVFEKSKKSKDISTTRKSTLGTGRIYSSKYGLSASVSKKRKKIEPPARLEPLEPLTDPPAFDDSVFTVDVDPSRVPTLSQLIRQPCCEVVDTNQLLPIRQRLLCRTLFRCPTHDLTICRGGYDPAQHGIRNYFSYTFLCPNIKFSREVQFTASGDEFSIFLTISNLSTTPMKVSIEPLTKTDDVNCVLCDTGTIDITIPRKDGTLTEGELTNLHSNSDPDGIGPIVFERYHRVGLHMKCRSACKSTRVEEAYLLVNVRYQTGDKEPGQGKVKFYVMPTYLRDSRE